MARKGLEKRPPRKTGMEGLAAKVEGVRVSEGAAPSQDQESSIVKRLRDIQAISDVMLQMGKEGLDDLLRGLLLRIREILRGDTATILLTAPEGTHLEVRAALGGQEESTNRVSVPLGRGFA